jgi:FkbM family methyltransferase
MLKKIIDTKSFNAVVKGRYGYIIYNKNDVYIGKAIEKYGEYSEHEVKLFRRFCSKGSIVVEVGANIGTHTLAFSKLVGKTGRVHTFEPQRIVFQTLCANIALNSLENVECYQEAISDEKGYLFLPDIVYDIEGNFGGIGIDKSNSGNKISVSTLDDLLQIPRLDFMKIDVEGMERKVINGAKNLLKKYKPILYVENDRPDKSRDLIELIRSMDYKLFWHSPPLFNKDNYAGESENIYPGIVSLNMLCVPKLVRIKGLREITNTDFHPFSPKMV